MSPHHTVRARSSRNVKAERYHGAARGWLKVGPTAEVFIAGSKQTMRVSSNRSARRTAVAQAKAQATNRRRIARLRARQAASRARRAETRA